MAYWRCCRPGVKTRDRMFSLALAEDRRYSSPDAVKLTAGSPPGLRAATPPRGWLPVRIGRQGGQAAVEWLYFGTRGLNEPFFQQTVHAVRRASGAEGVTRTALVTLMAVEEEIRPSAIVFHISRCGSTLLANALRAATGAVVVSEPQPVSAVANAPALLAGAVRSYGRRRNDSERLVFLKLSGGNLMAIGTFRRLWPEVPFLVVIRNPVEVMVSCLSRRPGWMRMRGHPGRAALRYGWKQREVEAMTEEEFCSRALAAMLAAPLAVMGERCRVIDYTQIDEARAHAVAGFIGLRVGGLDRACLKRVFANYSKDQSGRSTFKADSGAKRAAASRLVLDAAERWAGPEYARLRAEARW